MMMNHSKTCCGMIKATSDSVFEECKFLNCDFSNGTFFRVKFIECVFDNCDLSLVRLSDCQLNDITFTECKLLGINFNDCNDSLFKVRFDSCILDFSSFAGKKMINTPFKNTSLKSVDFTGSDLTRTVFSNCDLMNAVFGNSVLCDSDFVTANNYIIDPEINKLKHARFSLNGLPGLLNRYDIIIE